MGKPLLPYLDCTERLADAQARIVQLEAQVERADAFADKVQPILDTTGAQGLAVWEAADAALAAYREQRSDE